MSDTTNGVNTKLDFLAIQLGTQHTQMMLLLQAMKQSVDDIKLGLLDPENGLLAVYLPAMFGHLNSISLSSGGILQQLTPNRDFPTGYATQAIASLEHLAPIDVQAVAMTQFLGFIHNGDNQTRQSQLASIIQKLIDILTAMNGDGNNPTSLQEYLHSLYACSPCGNVNDNACDPRYESTGINVKPSGWSEVYEPGVYAEWAGDLPDGVSLSADIADFPIQTRIAADDWTGYRMYVKSDYGQWGFDPDNVYQFPTNQWVEIPGGNYAFTVHVPLGHSLQAYLCPPGDPPDPPDPRFMAYNDIGLSTTTDAACNSQGVGFVVNGHSVGCFGPKVRVQYNWASNTSSNSGNQNGTTGPISVCISGAEIGTINPGEDKEFLTDGGLFELKTTQPKQCSAGFRVWWYDEPLP